ncbi:hypothetical protein [Pseudoalteromonas xiamenensis]|uniref:Uncharacterized protein n=1 Tax=Pseudoalteromonas xiamenensis TaxID=882626 RepID=A0A975DK11_9GAMM|nr:hypothetical protein [Pseudoalteromonas xiamenensis]QTH72964.1 hypothetical protein J5O05_17545 [Pseudoalteromonas xiamenensis]
MLINHCHLVAGGGSKVLPERGGTELAKLSPDIPPPPPLVEELTSNG